MTGMPASRAAAIAASMTWGCQHALGVVRQHHGIDALKPGLDDVDDARAGRRLDGTVGLAVGAQELLASGDITHLGRRSPAALDQQVGLNVGFLADH